MKTRTILRHVAPKLVAVGMSLWLVGSCQRAEIDLAPLLRPLGGAGGTMAGDGGMSPATQGGSAAVNDDVGGGGETSIDSPRGGGGASTAGTGQGGVVGGDAGVGGAVGGDTSAGGAVGGDMGAAGAGEAAGGGGGDPACPVTVSESWDMQLDAAGSEWVLAFGDPKVDVANHRLMLSFDDVVKRVKTYQGSYYVTTTVTLSGGTVLSPYPYSNEGPFPSLRRSADGGAIELGRTKYGQTNGWSSAGWPTLGASLPGTVTVQLTTYVKAGAQAVASKVSYGNAVYRSEWVSGFLWPQTNLGILQYVGQNNSVVFVQQEPVYVGTLSGCEALSDAAVEELYEN